MGPGRRAGRAALAGAALALAALACAPRPRPPAEVVFWPQQPLRALEPLIRRFQAENPGLVVRLRALDPATARDTVEAALAAGAVPDLCELSGADMAHFMTAGVLSDWSAGVASLRDSLRGWELCTVGDAVYGLPWTLQTRALFWNRNLFARARLDTTQAPETWADVRRAAAAIQRLGHGVHGYGLNANERHRLFEKFMPYAWGAGGEILSAGLDSARFDSPQNRAALEFYAGLRKAGLIGLQDALDREFEAGRLGLELAGPWLLARLRGDAPLLRFGVALVPRPARDRGEHASIADGDALVSFAGSRHKPEALRLARFLVRPDVAVALAAADPEVEPSGVGLDTLAWYAAHPSQQVLVRQLATARFRPRHPDWDAMESAIEDEIEQVLYDKKTVAQAAADADARLAELAGGRQP